MPPGDPFVEVEVWDLPVRLVHWALVLLLAFQLASAYAGGEWMRWHAWSGYTILVLVLFRILWGFAGTTYARFASFVAGPAAVARFLPKLAGKDPLPYASHNPLAGWMVVALLLSLLLQAASGLFSNDGAGFEGPLAALVGVEASTTFAYFHRGNLQVLLVLSTLHTLAALYHFLVRRENVIGAMFTGTKRLPLPAPAAMTRVPAWRTLGALAAALVFVYVVVQVGG